MFIVLAAMPLASRDSVFEGLEKEKKKPKAFPGIKSKNEIA